MRNPNPFQPKPKDKPYAYETTSMVRIPTKTRDALQELIEARDLNETLGQLITILQREASEKQNNQ